METLTLQHWKAGVSSPNLGQPSIGEMHINNLEKLQFDIFTQIIVFSISFKIMYSSLNQVIIQLCSMNYVPEKS